MDNPRDIPLGKGTKNGLNYSDFTRLVSRMTEENCQLLVDKYGKDPTYLEESEYGIGGWTIKIGPAYSLINALIDYGPTNRFRNTLEEKEAIRKVNLWEEEYRRAGRAFDRERTMENEFYKYHDRSKDTIESVKNEMLSDWQLVEGTRNGNFMQAAINKAFHKQDETIIYWSRDTAGVILKDPGELRLKAVEQIYAETQSYYGRKKNRGV